MLTLGCIEKLIGKMALKMTNAMEKASVDPDECDDALALVINYNQTLAALCEWIREGKRLAKILDDTVGADQENTDSASSCATQALPPECVYRIVICCDVDADTATEAYEKLYRALLPLDGFDTGIQWESTDEWFDADGEPMTEDEISAIRLEVITKLDQEIP